MKMRSYCAMLIAAGFMLCGDASFALPKAAEHEDAAVLTVADVARPKRALAKTSIAAKAKAAAPQSGERGRAQKAQGPVRALRKGRALDGAHSAAR